MQWPVDPGRARPGGAVTTVGKLVWDEMWVLATQFRSGSATTAQRHAGVGGVPANVALAAAQSGCRLACSGSPASVPAVSRPPSCCPPRCRCS